MAAIYLRHFPHARRQAQGHTPRAPRPSTWTLWQGTAAMVCGLTRTDAQALLTTLRQEFPTAPLRLTRQAA